MRGTVMQGRDEAQLYKVEVKHKCCCLPANCGTTERWPVRRGALDINPSTQSHASVPDSACVFGPQMSVSCSGPSGQSGGAMQLRRVSGGGQLSEQCDGGVR